jgi:hypothetical protein
MSRIVVPGRKNKPTADAEKYKKDCADFECMLDGTMTGECKYCKWSLECQQIDYDDEGNVIPMEVHYLPLADETGQIMEHELFCTGMHDERSKKERIEDDKVS